MRLLPGQCNPKIILLEIILLEHKAEFERNNNIIIPIRNVLDWNYSVHHYTFKDVTTPTNERDALNLVTLEPSVKPCLKLNSNGTMYPADGIRINDVVTPTRREVVLNEALVEGKVKPYLKLNSDGTMYNDDGI